MDVTTNTGLYLRENHDCSNFVRVVSVIVSTIEFLITWTNNYGY